MFRRHRWETEDRKTHFVFQWHITDECGQRCRHCYIYGADAAKRPDTMPWEQLVNVLEMCMRFCGQMYYQPHICLTGGDPLMHPDFWRLAGLLHMERIPFSILGNPGHLTDAVCRRLKKLGCTRYQLSIDGLEETHDRFRAPGSYRDTMDKIAMLNRARIETAVMTTVSSRNIDEVPAVIDAVVAAKAGIYAFGRYCAPSGALNDIPPERYRRLLADCTEKIRGLQDAGCKTRFAKKDHLWTLYDYETGCFQLPADAEKGMLYDGCHCGQSHLTILPNGDVYACRRVHGSKVGHLPEDTFADIWLGRMAAYRDLSRFEKCSSCDLLQWCRGCPAVASTKDGNFYAPDPQCWRTVAPGGGQSEEQPMQEGEKRHDA